MKRLIFLVLLLAGCTAPAATPEPASRPPLESLARTLASDDFAGRLTGTDGERKAADFIQSSWPRTLEPLLADGFRHSFDFKMHGGGASRGTNLIGSVKGTERPYDLVVIGAHYDHLGPNHPGADDNASGTAVLVELAHRFAAKPAKRTIVIAHFSGEELGILGSKAFAAALPQTLSTVAMLNMDMVGRVRDDRLIVLGTDTADEWPKILTDSNPGLTLTFGKGGIGPSDHTAFYLKNVPVLHFFSGAHADYHKATDTAEKLNVAGMAKVADLVEHVARRVADTDARPTFKKSDADFVPKDDGPPPPGAPPYFGAMPSYTDPSVMEVETTTAGSPAEKCGLKAGDRILELDGKPVESLQDYSDRLRKHRAGDEITLKVKRGNDVFELKATLAARKGH